MDFVVVGFGVGALGVLLGVLLGGWLAGRCERAAARAADQAVAAYERANAAECRGAGQAFLAAGGAVILATVGGLAGGLSDRSGALLVTTTATVAALGIILWGVLFRSRNPMPPRPRRTPAAVGTANAVAVAPAFAVPATAAEPDFTVAHDAIAPRNGEAATDAEEAEAVQPADAIDVPKAETAAEAGGLAAAGTVSEHAEAAANGHPAAEGGSVDDARIVAFVGLGARTSAENEAQSDDENGATNGSEGAQLPRD